MTTALIVFLLFLLGAAWLVVMAVIELAWLAFKLVFGLGAALFGVGKFLLIMAGVALFGLFKGFIVLALAVALVALLGSWLLRGGRRRGGTARDAREAMPHERAAALAEVHAALSRMERRQSHLEGVIRRRRDACPY